MPEAVFFAAVDGGGTHTRARITLRDGTTVAEKSISRTAKFFEVGFAESARRIATLIAQTAASGRVPKRAIAGVCVGLAGNGRDRDQRALRAHLLPALHTKNITPKTLRLESDAAIALPGLLGNDAGVVLICGTGAILVGRTSKGAIVRVGGWGRLIGDEGSGYWIGAQALNAVGRDLDHRIAHTQLTDAVFASFSALKTREPRELRSAIARGDIRVERIAPLVSLCAAKGDRAARAILQRAADELCDQLLAMHRGHFARHKSVPLVFHGGVVESSPVGDLLRRALRRNAPGAYRVIRPVGTPLDGAIALLRTNAAKDII